MATAYILLNIKSNSETQIISKIKEIMGANQLVGYEIQGVYGVYDIVVKVSCKNMEDIRNVLGKIRRVDQVISTITMLVNEAQEE
ncbi:MAG TPA: Lrp/AsnC ligand binding domain-containing protein [Candidatus Nitrosotalea sp.]|nr:Lrp/AsnC ligand binding domain-containing protein [Candidatus Nitrosotalea sp.]